MSRRTAAFMLLLAAAGGTVAACTRASEPITPCEDEGVILSIGSGTTPRFSWTPACFAFRLLVTDTANVTLWGVVTDSASALSPGVIYGAVPSGATQIQAPVALVAGKPYIIGLFRFTGPAADSGEIIAAQQFTP